MKSNEIRARFLEYFQRHGHTMVSSSPLVPGNDPTLLFTNAGMVQFKDLFLGQEKRPYVRAATSQRCVRAGGKHNDLENVGYTARHHTFFEMLGNFSFGDYFKEEAIELAWRLLTEEFAIPRERLWVTVHADDDEAARIWIDQVGVPPERLVRIATNDNFWQMGDTGPCGPCTEIFYDHGPGIPGGPPGTPDADGDRYIEIWNLVFMQYNRDEAGVLHPLPRPSVDTGMGLERISAVLQRVHSNYEIDLFQDLLAAAARVTGAQDLANNSLKVIADHIRACSFLICDGVVPGNEGRGYVLRRIVRRAIRHGYKLGQKRPFFHELVADLAALMGSAYPELVAAAPRVADVLRLEEERFAETLEHGMHVLEGALKKEDRMLDGDTVFRLYDTYGFPLDLTADVARERGVQVDFAGFEAEMQRQRERARAASRFSAQTAVDYDGAATEFLGYDALKAPAQVLALYRDGQSIPQVSAGQTATVVLDRTPFYAESGGQVGDRGQLTSGSASFDVTDTQKLRVGVFGHLGTLRTGRLAVGDDLTAEVDAGRRGRSARNHSATHLMHAALRSVLGAHVQQKGSLVDAEKTRFDFVHTAALSPLEIREIERLVNREIRANASVETRLMRYDDAVKAGAVALFGEKYGDEVRVVGMGEFSTELCGGTHVQRSGDIGLFKVLAQSAVAAGVRRLEATTGEGALALVQSQYEELESVAEALKAPPGEIAARLQQVLEHSRSLERELGRLKSRLAASRGDDLAAGAQRVGESAVLAQAMPEADSKTLREALDSLKGKLGSCVIVLASVEGKRVNLIAGVSADLTARVKAGELVNFVAQQVGGKGGGRPEMAQAGGSQPQALGSALESVMPWVRERLAS